MQAPLNGSTTTTNSHSSPSTLRVDIQLSVEDDQLDSNMIWFLLLMVQNSNNHLGCIKTLKIPGNDYQLQLVFSPDFWTINSITLNDFRIFFQCNSSSWWFQLQPLWNLYGRQIGTIETTHPSHGLFPPCYLRFLSGRPGVPWRCTTATSGSTEAGPQLRLVDVSWFGHWSTPYLGDHPLTCKRLVSFQMIGLGQFPFQMAH